MRNGIEILEALEAELLDMCACNRYNACALRVEVGEYLDKATKRTEVD